MKSKVKVTSVEIFLDELSKKGLPIELIGEYKGSGKKTTFRCKTCGNEWEAQPYAVLHYQSLGCIKCRDKDQGKRKRKLMINMQKNCRWLIQILRLLKAIKLHEPRYYTDVNCAVMNGV